MKKKVSKKRNSKNSFNRNVLVGIVVVVLLLIIGIKIGRYPITGNVVGTFCEFDFECDAGEYCVAGYCESEEYGNEFIDEKFVEESSYESVFDALFEDTLGGFFVMMKGFFSLGDLGGEIEGETEPVEENEGSDADTLYCGDDICSSSIGETEDNCQIDCYFCGNEICMDGEICDESVFPPACVGCISDDDCTEENYICEAGICNLNSCGGCLEGEVCNEDVNPAICVECINSAQCGDDQICVVPGNFCAECINDNSCSAGEECIANVCVLTGCNDENGVSTCAPGEYCDTSVVPAVCTGCTSDDHCTEDNLGYCGAGICYECVEDDHCNAGYVCDPTGICVQEGFECTTNEDCGPQEMCNAGVCEIDFGIFDPF